MPYVIQHIIFSFVFMPPSIPVALVIKVKIFAGFNSSDRDFTHANLERVDCSKAILNGSVFKKYKCNRYHTRCAQPLLIRHK